MFNDNTKFQLELSLRSKEKVRCEIFIDGIWKEFDGHGKDTEKSREYYSKVFKPFAQGSFPLRYGGMVNENSSEDSIFYIRR